MTVNLTKKTALAIFRGELAEATRNGTWTYSKADAVARREAWNNFTDSLCKDGMISDRQYDTWSNPF